MEFNTHSGESLVDDAPLLLKRRHVSYLLYFSFEMLSPPFQLHEKNDSGAHDTGEDDDEPTGTLKDAEWPIIGNMSSQEHERTEQDDSGGDSERQEMVKQLRAKMRIQKQPGDIGRSSGRRKGFGRSTCHAVML